MTRVLFCLLVIVLLGRPVIAQDSVVSLPPPLASASETPDAADDASSSEEPGPPAPCNGKTITIAKMQWPTAQLLAEIHARLVKQQVGCDVEVVQGDLAATPSSMGANGQPAVAPELWITRVADVWNNAR